MVTFDRKNHWENIYETKELNTVSWYQPIPHTSIKLIEEANLSKNAKIIDIGGGDSLLVDQLLDLGYTDITVLDISQNAFERAKARLGHRALNIKWIVADASDFVSSEKYDFWHDRAAFHFFTKETEIRNYIENLYQKLSNKGVLAIGTFSENGPKKCTGIEIRQYSESTMDATFMEYFKKQKCFTVDHQTPSGAIQNFVFCTFIKK